MRDEKPVEEERKFGKKTDISKKTYMKKDRGTSPFFCETS